ncbi:AAA family ATPase [Azospirillum agricola]|uniref:AAA family ATPase n=1 Tax=Azospirillum agricola TaxID=1720247 RepID=UPI000A0F094E|nr:AAA family ATPase [Azospirillum agricola]SMH62985.1 Predicted kinase [Azospirillum lipoferum]
MLVIFAGLPGTGKSTIAQPVAARLAAVYLRIDSIEQAIRSSGILPPDADIGPAGYMTAYRVAADNLRLGRSVVVDSVNPLKITRDAYRAVAVTAGAGVIEVETVCSDLEIHRRRVETRPPDVEGLALPSWEQVAARAYERWDRPCLRLDTAQLPVARSVELILDAVSSADPRRS